MLSRDLEEMDKSEKSQKIVVEKNSGLRNYYLTQKLIGQSKVYWDMNKTVN